MYGSVDPATLTAVPPVPGDQFVEPPATPQAEAAPTTSPLFRFGEVLGTLAAAAVEGIADPSNQAAWAAWAKDIYQRAKQTPAEDLAVAIVRAAGYVACTFADVLRDGLKPAK